MWNHWLMRCRMVCRAARESACAASIRRASCSVTPSDDSPVFCEEAPTAPTARERPVQKLSVARRTWLTVGLIAKESLQLQTLRAGERHKPQAHTVSIGAVGSRPPDHLDG